MINSNLKLVEKHKKTSDLAKIAGISKPGHLAKVARIYLANQEYSVQRIKRASQATFANTKKIVPKIVGDTRHYPPANKEWKNSIYAYNKDSLRSSAALDKVASRTIKSYFNLTNNRKLARSYRMRNLIRRTTSKRIFASKPEIKQTSNKVNITVYIFNREGQFLLRKLYFYKKNMSINRDIYLHKIWLKKNLLAFKKTFKGKKSIRLLAKNKKLMTKRKKRNKTYIHNILIKRYLNHNSSKKTEVQLLMRRKSNGSINSIKSNNIRKLELNSLIRKNILKSLKRRNLIKSLKKREKLSRAITPYANNASSGLKNIYLLSKMKFFENYLIEKRSRKIKFKLRNSSSIIKIKKKLSRFFFLRGKRRKKRFKKMRLPYSNLKFKNEIKFFSFKLVSELKYIRKLFLFRFIKYIFSLLKIKIHLSKRLGPAGFTRHIRKKNFSTLSNSNKQLKIKGLNLAKIKRLNLAKIKRLNLAKIKLLNLGKKNYFFNYLSYEFMDKDINKKTKKSRKAKKSNKAKKNKKILRTSFKNKYSYNKLKKIELLNLELLNFLKYIISGGIKKSQFSKNKKLRMVKLRKVLKNSNNNLLNTIVFNKNNFDTLYKKFEKKYFLRFLAKYFKKEFLYINYFSRFLINKFKFGKFLPGLKYLINKIYSKKVKLNIVNLKYPHLNSDIYADSIASKLKKKLGLLRVLRSSLSLAKLPSEYLSLDRLANYNKLPSLTIHKTLNVNDLSNKNDFGVESKLTEKNLDKDPLDVVLNKLYPYSFVTAANHNSFHYENKLDSSEEKPNSLQLILNLPKKSTSLTDTALSKNLKILNLIKYKWVSGVRLEAAGRLTRRYTAARSVFKFRYKGSLKNIDYSQKLDTSKKNASTVMLRNYAKSNSQYSFSKSKRRIGAFGLKAWIASY